MCVCVRMSMASLSHLLRTLFHSLPKIDVLMPSLDHHVRRTRECRCSNQAESSAYIVLSKKGGGILYTFCQCQAYNIIYISNLPDCSELAHRRRLSPHLPAPFCTLAPQKTSSVCITPFSLSMKTLSEKYSPASVGHSIADKCHICFWVG